MALNRYQRQTQLRQIGPDGQEKLGRARVVLVGCGALGTVIAEQLVRAGIGRLRIIDRDLVELSNLQRQVLFDEADAKANVPKSIAAAERLRRINSQVTIVPLVADLNSDQAESLCELGAGECRPDLLLDGTDNVQTRFLLNDVVVKHAVPWIYGACVGSEGRLMVIRPGETACLRCVFPDPPGAGELPTCETAGVLGAASGVVASLQAAAAIKLLVGGGTNSPEPLLSVDIWAGRFRAVSLLGARRDDCPACGRRQFEFLNTPVEDSVTLCGREAVQVRPIGRFSQKVAKFDLDQVARKLERCGAVEQTPYLVRCRPEGPDGVQLTLFPDGRLIIHGLSDPLRAKSLYARYIGE